MHLFIVVPLLQQAVKIELNLQPTKIRWDGLDRENGRASATLNAFFALERKQILIKANKMLLLQFKKYFTKARMLSE